MKKKIDNFNLNNLLSNNSDKNLLRLSNIKTNSVYIMSKVRTISGTRVQLLIIRFQSIRSTWTYTDHTKREASAPDSTTICGLKVFTTVFRCHDNSDFTACLTRQTVAV